MDSNGNNRQGDGVGEGAWSGRKRRDDTPSFIRDVQARAEMLNPVRSGDAIPVLTMPSSVRLWRKIRWPLFIFIVLGILVAVGLFTNDRLVARRIERKIADARTAESVATIDSLSESDENLAALAKRHPGRINAQVAYAWNAMLMAELFGSVEERLENASPSFELSKSDNSPTSIAAKAARRYHLGDPSGALEEVEKGLKEHPGEPRLQLVRAIALKVAGRGEEAAEVLLALRTSKVDYLPALHVQLTTAIEDGDEEAAKAFAAELLTVAPGDLHGVLASIAVRLPEWGARRPGNAFIATLVAELRVAEDRIPEAPPKISLLGRYVAGRVYLLARQLDKAKKDLKFASNNGMDEALAWYALAVRESSGPAEALSVLEKVGDDPGPEVASLRASCFLDFHQVKNAAAAIDALEASSGAEAVSRLRWILAVRDADLGAAKEHLPGKIGGDLMWVGLEMYHLARLYGDREAIGALRDRFEGDAGSCGVGIGAWHEETASGVYKKLDPASKDGCTSALVAKLMRGHVDPGAVEKAAARSVDLSDGEMFPLVDKALALWLSKGREAALAPLEQIEKRDPDGKLIRIAMAEAYLLMGLPAKAQGILDGLAGPVVMSLKIEAATNAGDKAMASSLIEEVQADKELRDQPAVAYWLLKGRLENSDFDKVVTRADEILENAGVWTAEIAELKAKALNAMGSRGDADRSLLSAAKLARSGSGLGEAWETKLALVRLNLRRGGNFLFKAVAVTLDLYKAGVKDAELSYSYAVANIRQGNERGAMRYLREAVELDPSFVPPFNQLKLMGKLEDGQAALLERTMPGTSLD